MYPLYMHPAVVQVAVVRDAGTEQRRVWAAPLASISEQTQDESLSPCVIIVGAVVNMTA
jgi:uroporphyrinogen III methyltransferase / synthase